MIIRRYLDFIWLSLFWASGLLILLVLSAMLAYLIWRGGPALSLEFLTASPRGIPLGAQGGVYPAIKGTFYLVLIAVVTAGIPGIITAIYLTEYGMQSSLKEIVNLTVQCMAGIPSIITGLFVYAFLVVQLKWGMCLMAGGIALGIMVLPVIVLTTRDAFLAVDNNYRWLGASLGVSRGYMFLRVILPQSVPAVLSGLLLAMGYAAGATAPIMVTAAVISSNSSGAWFEPVMALPYHLYILFSEHTSMDKAYGTALLLVLLLLVVNIIALWIRSWQGRDFHNDFRPK
ncbi:MAG: phosphate ABC transporter permease PstA [Syntrophomonas sp.]|nr:phosphate ABC transporter permease PstA [Syntrophomonas sp.]